MSRNIKAPALVLKIYPVGENHRGVAMLVAGEGILHPLAFGAQGKRSTLRASAVPFNVGLANLYYDGAKNRWRLLAFDPSEDYDGLRENLDRFYTVNTWAEILLKTYSGGEDSKDLYGLAVKGLSLLSCSEGESIMRLKVGFFWHFLSMEGVQPNPLHCGHCGKFIPIGKQSAPARFLSNGTLLASDCSYSSAHEISDGARAWLQGISADLEGSVKIGLNMTSLRMAEKWVNTVVQAFIDRPLKTFSITQI